MKIVDVEWAHSYGKSQVINWTSIKFRYI
jgi:hypothetical protein